MANCLFSFPDRTLHPTTSMSTSGAAWSTGFPLTNLQNSQKSKVARSTGITTTYTKFDITLDVAKIVRIVSLLNHNAYIDATVTLSFSNVALGGSELGQYTGLEFWGQYYPSEIPIEWEEDEFWGGTLYDADADDYHPSPDFWHCLPAPILCKYIRVEVTDVNNPAGYFQLGRCFVGNGLQPQVNMDYGASVGWKQDVDKASSVGGTDWYNVKSIRREMSGQLNHLSVAEGMVMMFDRQRRLGQAGELYFIFDPDDTVQLYKQRAMLCTFGDEDPLQYPFFDASSGSFRLVEVI